MNHKIIAESDIPALRKTWVGDRVVLAGGCFDLLHYGHYSFLVAARARGDRLVIALEPDEFILRRKKRTPVHTQRQRAEILAGLEMVSHVILLPLYASDSQYAQLVSTVRPSVIAVTAGDVNLSRKQAQAAAIGAEVVEVVPKIETFSSSSIIQYARLLGD